MASNESGNFQSVVGSLFFGEIDEKLIFPFPHFSDAQVETAKEMTAAIDQFAKDNINGEKFDTESHIPDEVIKGLGADLLQSATAPSFGVRRDAPKFSGTSSI